MHVTTTIPLNTCTCVVVGARKEECSCTCSWYMYMYQTCIIHCVFYMYVYLHVHSRKKVWTSCSPGGRNFILLDMMTGKGYRDQYADEFRTVPIY